MESTTYSLVGLLFFVWTLKSLYIHICRSDIAYSHSKFQYKPSFVSNKRDDVVILFNDRFTRIAVLG